MDKRCKAAFIETFEVMISSWYIQVGLSSKGAGQENAKSKRTENTYAATPQASAAEEKMPYAFQQPVWTGLGYI